MDRKQQLLIRNIVAGAVLLALIVVVAVWAGLFEGAESDDAQIRALIERARDEINDHDYDDFLKLCNLTPAEREAWKSAIDGQPLSNFVVVDTLEPRGFISVPAGASEYQIEVNAISHLEVPFKGSLQADSINGTFYFVKVEGRWRIDLDKSAATLPYIPKPKRP